MRALRTALLAAALAMVATATPASAFVVQEKGGLQAPSEGIALGADGNLWISETNTGTVVRMSPSGTVLDRFSVGSQPRTVTTGPGGRVWIAVTGADKLVWFDATSTPPTAHDVTLGGTTCGPIGIVSGGNGRMYFSTPVTDGCLVGGNALNSVADDGTDLNLMMSAIGSVFDLEQRSGKIFAPDSPGDVVRRLSLTGVIEQQVPVAGGPQGVSFDGAGNIWVTAFISGGLGRFPAGQNTNAPATQITPPGGTLTRPFGIIGAADGNMYVAGSDSANIARVALDGGAAAFFPVPGAQPWDIINGPDGDLWLTDRSSANRVLRFVNAAPRATTGAAVGTTATATTMTATVDPRGNETQVVFDYGPTTAYGATSAPVPVANGADPVAVAAALSGLAPSTTYHVRARAANALGSAEGADATFTTPAAAVAALPVATPAVRRLAVSTSFSVRRFPNTTIVRSIKLTRLAGGETATIRCTGRRCAFKTKTYRNLKRGTRTFGRTLLRNRRLPVNTTLSVRVTKPGTIGRSTVLKVRRRKAPLITRRCLPPGSTTPARCG